MCPRIIIEEEPARRVGTTANRRALTLDEEFSGGTREGREKPVQAAFTGYELERPGTLVSHEFVVPFGNPQYFIDRLDPGRRERLSINDGSEDGAERFA